MTQREALEAIHRLNWNWDSKRSWQAAYKKIFAILSDVGPDETTVDIRNVKKAKRVTK